jgi:gluconolactonase
MSQHRATILPTRTPPSGSRKWDRHRTSVFRSQSRFRCVTWVLTMTAAVLAGAGELPPSHSVEPQLYATGFAFAEGPALDRDGNLFVVNYRTKGTIGRITPDGTASIWCDLSELATPDGRKGQANGLKIDSSGRLIVADAGGGRLLRVSADGKQIEVLADRCDGVRFQSINDVALDRQGNIYFTDPGSSSVDQPVGAVYRYDIQTKRTTLLAAKLAFPNGLAVTPDQRQLCVAESLQYRLLLFDLDAPSGTFGNQRVLIDFPREKQGELVGGDHPPDGMVFDAQGRLYVAMWTGGVINVVELPSGRLIRQYSAGGPQVTNCHFHAPYLYTTVAAKEAVFRLKLDVAGFEYVTPVSAGAEPPAMP